MSRLALGKRGELLACEYLVDSGYHILSTNQRTKSAEIDIVALDSDVLVFVEVKSRRGDSYGMAQEAVDFRKQAKLCRAAMEYMLIKRVKDKAVRFDVVAVNFSPEGHRIELYKNAFDMQSL